MNKKYTPLKNYQQSKNQSVPIKTNMLQKKVHFNIFFFHLITILYYEFFRKAKQGKLKLLNCIEFI